jgi:hypothetical protein
VKCCRTYKFCDSTGRHGRAADNPGRGPGGRTPSCSPISTVFGTEKQLLKTAMISVIGQLDFRWGFPHRMCFDKHAAEIASLVIA